MQVFGLGVTQRTRQNDGNTPTLQILLIVVSNKALVGVLHMHASIVLKLIDYKFSIMITTMPVPNNRYVLIYHVHGS